MTTVGQRKEQEAEYIAVLGISLYSLLKNQCSVLAQNSNVNTAKGPVSHASPTRSGQRIDFPWDAAGHRPKIRISVPPPALASACAQVVVVFNLSNPRVDHRKTGRTAVDRLRHQSRATLIRGLKGLALLDCCSTCAPGPVED